MVRKGLLFSLVCIFVTSSGMDAQSSRGSNGDGKSRGRGVIDALGLRLVKAAMSDNGSTSARGSMEPAVMEPPFVEGRDNVAAHDVVVRDEDESDDSSETVEVEIPNIKFDVKLRHKKKKRGIPDDPTDEEYDIAKEIQRRYEARRGNVRPEPANVQAPANVPPPVNIQPPPPPPYVQQPGNNQQQPYLQQPPYVGQNYQPNYQPPPPPNYPPNYPPHYHQPMQMRPMVPQQQLWGPMYAAPMIMQHGGSGNPGYNPNPPGHFTGKGGYPAQHVAGPNVPDVPGAGNIPVNDPSQDGASILNGNAGYQNSAENASPDDLPDYSAKPQSAAAAITGPAVQTDIGSHASQSAAPAASTDHGFDRTQSGAAAQSDHGSDAGHSAAASASAASSSNIRAPQSSRSTHGQLPAGFTPMNM